MNNPIIMLTAFLGRMIANDPIAAGALVIFAFVVPSIVPITLLSPLYWLAWWTLLASLVIATVQGQPLGMGGALSAALSALMAPRRVAAAGGGGDGQSPPQSSSAGQAETGTEQSRRDEARNRLRDALRAYMTSQEVVQVNNGEAGIRVTWTGTRVSPEERRAREMEVLATLEQRLKERVRGQDHVTRAISRHLIRQAAGVREKRRRPLLSILAVGPTGTGKTELAKALAEVLGRPLIVYDMSNFSAPHTVSALVGSPPGYVGSDRPGRLVSDINARPNAVLLFDEFEKAYSTVSDVLLAALDEGRVKELSQGVTADCTDVIFYLTSNLLSREATQGWTDDPAVVRQMLLDARGGMPAYGGAFALRPEFVNRIDVITLFRPLDRPILEDIARSFIAAYAQQVAVNQNLPSLEVSIDEAVIDAVLDRCDTAFGARDLKRAVDLLIGDALVEGYIPWLAQAAKPSRLAIKMSSDKVVAEYAS